MAAGSDLSVLAPSASPHSFEATKNPLQHKPLFTESTGSFVANDPAIGGRGTFTLPSCKRPFSYPYEDQGVAHIGPGYQYSVYHLLHILKLVYFTCYVDSILPKIKS